MNIAVPAVVRHPLVRVLPLEGFDPVELVALWHGAPTPLIRAVLTEIQRYVRQVWPEAASADTLK